MLELIKGFLRAYWTKFTWELFDWLSSARAVTLTLLVFTAVIVVASRPRYRRRMATAGLTLLAAYWFVVSPLFSVPATQLLVHLVPTDTGETADAVVVLARESAIQGGRYETAVDMLDSGRAYQLLVMGRVQGDQVLRQLEQRHLSPDRLSSAVCVRTTYNEAHSASAILGSRGATKIILITDPPHMLRAWLTFKSLGFVVIPHLEPIPDWLPHHERSFLAIREYLGLISYAALGRFERHPTSALPQLAQEMLAKYPLDNCFMTADQIRQSLPSS